MKLCTMPAQTPLYIGTRLIETLWYAFATRIVDKAIEIYKLDEDRATALKAKILKRGEFIVEPLTPSGLL
jgi:hypothetical protein